MCVYVPFLQLLFFSCISWEIRNYRGPLSSPFSCSFSSLVHIYIHKHYLMDQEFGLWLNYGNFKFSGPKSLGNLDLIVSSVSQLDISWIFSNLNPQQLYDISLGFFRHEICFYLPSWLEVVQEIVTDTLRCANGAVKRNVEFILKNVAASRRSRKCEFVRIRLVHYGMMVGENKCVSECRRLSWLLDFNWFSAGSF